MPIRSLLLILQHKIHSYVGNRYKTGNHHGGIRQKIWSEVLAMWLKEKTAQTEETEPKYEVESQSHCLF